MARVALWFAYDGTRFDSFARQPKQRTVEGELVGALRRAGALRQARAANFEVASRTDKGVSAWGNVCAFDTRMHASALVHAARTPEGLHLLGAAAAPDGFSPRRAAMRRTYRYVVAQAADYDWTRLGQAARLFRGRHDFRNFCRLEPGVDPVRRIESIAVGRQGGSGWIRVTAPNFLWEQVRRTVHALFEVGAGRRDVAEVRTQLEEPSIRRAEPPAAPEPLWLESVELPIPAPPASKSLFGRLREESQVAWLRSRLYAGLLESVPTTRR